MGSSLSGSIGFLFISSKSLSQPPVLNSAAITKGNKNIFFINFPKFDNKKITI
jgi:hypothetical protein